MLHLEEYIAQRKKEDHLNEFDMEQKIGNMRTCIDYIFEYFDQYLVLEGAQERTLEENELLTKYEKSLRDYSPEIRQWLVKIYDETGHQINKTIMKYCDGVPEFFLIYEESEFRSVSYDCYANIIGKRPMLKDQTEKLYQFIKEYHTVISKREYETFGFPKITEAITKWLEHTYQHYHVNLMVAVDRYLDRFFDNVDMWPPGSRIKAKDPYPGHPYDYNYKRRVNRFNVNGFYRIHGKKPFIKGKKKALEILMLQLWTNGFDGDERDFFEECLKEDKL